MHIESAERIVLAKLARLRSFMEGRKEQAMVILFFRISLAFTLTAAFVVCRPTPVVAQGVPDLSRFDDATRESIELACIRQKAQGPVVYGSCLNEQISALRSSPGIPSLSGLDDATRESIELACIRQKAQGPVAYGEGLQEQIRSIGIQPGEATRVPSSASRRLMRLKMTAPPS